MSPVRCFQAVLGVLCLAVLAGGCGRRSFATEGDALRERVLELEHENERLAGRVDELMAELDSARAVPDTVAPEVRAAIPHVVQLGVGRLSHRVDRDRDGDPEAITIYLEPVDGRSRFVQLVGDVSVTATLIPREGDARTVGQVTLDPAALRDAYRSGVTGTHYTVDCPIDLPAGGVNDLIIVRADFRDGRTGRVITANGKIGGE